MQNPWRRLCTAQHLPRRDSTFQGAGVSALVICALLIIVRSLVAAETQPPAGANRTVLADNVVVYHWLETTEVETERVVRILPLVTAWPKGTWGAEVTMTPVPDCCGAKVSTVRWRKSSPEQIRSAGVIDATSQYRLEFRFK